MLNSNAWSENTQVDSGLMACIIERVDSASIPWVRSEGGHTVPAKYTTSVSPQELSSAAESGAKALVAILTDTQEPVIVGIIASPAANQTKPVIEPLSADIDGERIVLNGRREIILRCGKASITLTKAGKILLRGAYVSSRSSGVNRIKGGSVQIN